MRVLITGVAGFIGFHIANNLLAKGHVVIGIDNLTSFYDISLKKARLNQLKIHPAFSFHRLDISSYEALQTLSSLQSDITHIIHLAAQAGVRYSLENPFSYITANVMGQVGMLEWARHCSHLKHFLYASSSSVYGLNPHLPFNENDRVDSPASLYAATKRSAELISFAYEHIYAFPQTGLRFFTVYGPWGRPDMAYYKFADHIMQEQSIPLYEGKNLSRDFTYITDVVAAVSTLLEAPPPVPSKRIVNIGNKNSESVETLITFLEKNLGKRAHILREPRPHVDVESTCADISLAQTLYGWRPEISLEIGIHHFCQWYLQYHQ